MKKLIFIGLSLITFCSQAQIPEDGGAIASDCSCIDYWGDSVEINRGYVNISDKSYEYKDSNKASFGTPENALGANVTSSLDAISLGDSGIATYYFESPISNILGPDFAIFENSEIDGFLELAFVEVSEDGVNFVRFPAVSNTSRETQIASFGSLEADSLYNLAGKYLLGNGTPFDLSDLEDSLIDLEDIHYIRIIDAVGDVTLGFGSEDVNGNLVNDPFPTPYHSAGFDLTGIAILKEFTSGLFSSSSMSSLGVYPNPSKGVVNFNDVLSGEVYNAQGELIFTFYQKNMIDLSTFDRGVYLIRTGNNFSDKVVIQ